MKSLASQSWCNFVIAICALCNTGYCWSASTLVELNLQENKWLEEHSILYLVVNVGPAPITFWDKPVTGEHFKPPGQKPILEKEPSNTLGGSVPKDYSFRPENPGQMPPPPGKLLNGVNRPIYPGRPLEKALKSEQKKFKGLAADYLKEIEKLLGIQFEVRLISTGNFPAAFEALGDGNVDLMPTMHFSDRIHPELVLTEPFIEIPLVIVTQKDTPFIEDLDMLAQMKVGGIISVESKLRDLGYKLKIEHYPPPIGLHNVATGKLDVFIGELTGISLALNRAPMPNLKISGEVPSPTFFSMAISKNIEEFVPIINKALDAIPEDQKNKIWKKWFPINYEKKWTSSFWLNAVALSIGILLFASLFVIYLLNRRFSRMKDAFTAIDPHLLSVQIDQNIIITEATDAFCKALGFESKDVIGRPLMTLGSPQKSKTNSMNEIWESVKQNKKWKGEVKLIKKDGSFLWAKTSISPLKRKSDNNGEFTVMYQDVTQLKHFEKLATKDELTGLYNRRHFNEVAPTLLNNAAKTKRTFALLLMDVDYFKKYNDQYGHPAGDKVLASIGKVLRKSLKRTNDLVFRLGGEEFGAIILVSNNDDCEKIGLKILNQIRKKEIMHEGNPPGVVTISMGIHSISSKESVDLQTIYKKADEALYKAKEFGRDQLVMSAYQGEQYLNQGSTAQPTIKKEREITN